MQKKLTITIEENIYYDLHSIIGKGRISKFIEKTIKPYVSNDNLRTAYREMADDEQREKEACQWEKGMVTNDFG